MARKSVQAARVTAAIARPRPPPVGRPAFGANGGPCALFRVMARKSAHGWPGLPARYSRGAGRDAEGFAQRYGKPRRSPAMPLLTTWGAGIHRQARAGHARDRRRRQAAREDAAAEERPLERLLPMQPAAAEAGGLPHGVEPVDRAAVWPQHAAVEVGLDPPERLACHHRHADR